IEGVPMRHGIELDEIDLALLTSLHEAPQIGVLETSRRIKVARATVQARLRKLEEAGVIAGYQPQIDLAAAGFGVQCFVQLHIAPVGDMKDLLARFETTPPEVVFEWHDSETDAVGWVVINSLRGGAAGGGTRMRAGLNRREVESLAKTMEVKFTVAGPPIGGA